MVMSINSILGIGHTLCGRESEAHGHQQGDHDWDERVSHHLPEHLVGVNEPQFGLRLNSFTVGADTARPGRVLLLLEDGDQGGGDEEDDAPEEEELGEGDDAGALEGGEEDVAQAPATSLSDTVAGGSVTNILRLQHCQGPTIHSHILDETDDQNSVLPWQKTKTFVFARKIYISFYK